MLADFKSVWKSKGLPILTGLLSPYAGEGIIKDFEVKDSYLDPFEIDLINPKQEAFTLDLEVYGKRVVEGLSFATDTPIKILDRIEYQGVLFECFEVKYQDLLNSYSVKTKVVEEDENI